MATGPVRPGAEYFERSESVVRVRHGTLDCATPRPAGRRAAAGPAHGAGPPGATGLALSCDSQAGSG